MSRGVVLDAGVLIGMLDRDDSHHRESVEAVARLADDGHPLFTSAMTLAEALVKPMKSGSAEADAARQMIVTFARITVVPIDEDLSLTIAEVRATQSSMKIPDAVVVAAATALETAMVLTTDHRLARLDRARTPRQILNAT